MLAAPALNLPLTAPPRRTRWVSPALSLALHLVLALAWLGFPEAEHRHDAEPAITVELQAEVPRPEPGKPARDSGSSASKGGEGTERGEAIPQLEDGLLAQRSSLPKPKAEVAPPAPRTDTTVKVKKPEPVTQNERDFVLGQVLKNWHPPRELAAYDKADVRVTVIVDADGYFDGAYDARRPPNPAAVFDGYDTLAAQNLQRRTVDAFYQAIRRAQPVHLPPALKAKAPFPVRLDFRFKDAR